MDDEIRLSDATQLALQAFLEEQKKMLQETAAESGNLFEEPAEYYKPEEEVHFTKYTRVVPNREPAALDLRLVGRHSLWGCQLWNAAITLSDAADLGTYPADQPTTASPGDATLLGQLNLDPRGKSVLELGAGAGCPALLCALNGASRVVITDYNEAPLIDNIRMNADLIKQQAGDIGVVGYTWGEPLEPVFELLDGNRGARFDIILLADLLWTRLAHEVLLKTCDKCLAADGTIYVAFAHHDPEKAPLDLNFFTLAAAAPFNFVVRKIGMRQMRDFFVENDGQDEIRGQVLLFTLRRS